MAAYCNYSNEEGAARPAVETGAGPSASGASASAGGISAEERTVILARLAALEHGRSHGRLGAAIAVTLGFLAILATAVFGMMMYDLGRTTGRQEAQPVTVTLTQPMPESMQGAAMEAGGETETMMSPGGTGADSPIGADAPAGPSSPAATNMPDRQARAPEALPVTPFTAGPGGAGTVSMPQRPGRAPQAATTNGGPAPLGPFSDEQDNPFPNAMSPPGHEGAPQMPLSPADMMPQGAGGAPPIAAGGRAPLGQDYGLPTAAQPSSQLPGQLSDQLPGQGDDKPNPFPFAMPQGR